MSQLIRTLLLFDPRIRPDAIYFDPETGANLVDSRRTPWYGLIFETAETSRYFYWSRQAVSSPDDIVLRAQTKLNAHSTIQELSGEVQRVHMTILCMFDLCFKNIAMWNVARLAQLSEGRTRRAMDALLTLGLLDYDETGAVTMVDNNGFDPTDADCEHYRLRAQVEQIF